MGKYLGSDGRTPAQPGSAPSLTHLGVDLLVELGLLEHEVAFGHRHVRLVRVLMLGELLVGLHLPDRGVALGHRLADSGVPHHLGRPRQAQHLQVALSGREKRVRLRFGVFFLPPRAWWPGSFFGKDLAVSRRFFRVQIRRRSKCLESTVRLARLWLCDFALRFINPRK